MCTYLLFRFVYSYLYMYQTHKNNNVSIHRERSPIYRETSPRERHLPPSLSLYIYICICKPISTQLLIIVRTGAHAKATLPLSIFSVIQHPIWFGLIKPLRVCLGMQTSPTWNYKVEANIYVQAEPVTTTSRNQGLWTRKWEDDKTGQWSGGAAHYWVALSTSGLT